MIVGRNRASGFLFLFFLKKKGGERNKNKNKNKGGKWRVENGLNVFLKDAYKLPLTQRQEEKLEKREYTYSTTPVDKYPR